MKKWSEIPEFINGFKVLKDLGVKKNKREGLVICRVCKKEYIANLWKLHKRKSCGCFKVDQLGKLPDYINGFKIVKDLGHDGKRRALVECKVCHRIYKVQVWTLDKRKHCGCAIPKPFKCSYRRSHPRLIRIYKCMKARCYNISDKSYKDYGAKGINIFKEWLENVDIFCEWAINNGYNDSLSIDRIDNYKGYFPGNCRWVTMTEQLRNRRSNKLSMDKVKMIRKDREMMTYKQLSIKYDVCMETIRQVLFNLTWKS